MKFIFKINAAHIYLWDQLFEDNAVNLFAKLIELPSALGSILAPFFANSNLKVYFTYLNLKLYIIYLFI